MKTIKKTLIDHIYIELESKYPITKTEKNYVFHEEDGIMVVSKKYVKDVNNGFYASGGYIHKYPSIIINNDDEIFYETNQEALIAYTKSTEQLNNPNVEYINF